MSEPGYQPFPPFADRAAAGIDLSVSDGYAAVLDGCAHGPIPVR